MPETLRTRRARELASAALVRLVRSYDGVPEFVLLGGLVPDLLCTRAPHKHAGTTDIDVQVNLEIANGAANAVRLEWALLAAGFTPDRERIWRWRDQRSPGLTVKAEFLADLDDQPSPATVRFDGCGMLGAANLRGTGFAARDWELKDISGKVDQVVVVATMRVTTIAGYLLAKTHAAHGRRAAKDWYDIAYVLIYNDHGGPTAAGRMVADRFGAELVGSTRTALHDLVANFGDARSQGAQAYAEGMHASHPDLDVAVLRNDAVAAVAAFAEKLALTE